MSPDDTPRSIVRVALRSMREVGYHATSLRTIATEVGIQPASVYHWYPSKDALLASIMTTFLQGLIQELERVLHAETDPVARLAAGVRTHVLFHGSQPDAAFVTDTEVRALHGDRRKVVMALRDDYEVTFFSLVADGVADGRLRSRDVPLATKAILLQCTGVAVWFKPSGRLSLEEVADFYVDLVLHSLRVEAAPRKKRPSRAA